ncbi:hypothetical protein T310_9570 [Rasamsonia emersonii CBS 393.64]|uniref:Uncharacterized protein n=1 Tax=Rasamsonia emersonii (strain ATCC 16479 / CBS 393.64 / IMI 116815) TaxID=1408163 RepID=A0A0F4YGU5_RASE3|nr:hypothetical protein T310_9570 [Rasamsonia emersonii CBS 393.64]KKA16853.1 hypothetical protein T310_9570 [Rasamsonia emersonii CBS 393.64]
MVSLFIFSYTFPFLVSFCFTNKKKRELLHRPGVEPGSRAMAQPFMEGTRATATPSMHLMLNLSADFFKKISPKQPKKDCVDRESNPDHVLSAD